MAGLDKNMHELHQGNIDQLTCGVCGQLTDSVLKFLQHKTTHMDRGVGRGCEICQLAFSRQAALCEHYKRKHNIIFDTVIESTIENVKRVKRQPKERAKVIRGKGMVTKIPLTEGLVQITTATVNLPNGERFDVVVENQNNDSAVINGSEVEISDKGLSENLKLNGSAPFTESDIKTLIGPRTTGLAVDGALSGATYLNTTKTLAVATATTETSVLTTSSASLTGSSVLVSPSTCTASTSFIVTAAGTGSATTSNLLTGSQSLTSSSTFAGPATLTSPAIIPDTTTLSTTTSLADLYQSQNTPNKMVLEINEGTVVIDNNLSKNDDMESLGSGTKFIIVRSLVKQNGDDITGNHLHNLMADEVVDESNSEQTVTLPEKGIFQEGNLDIHSAEVLHGYKRKSDNVDDDSVKNSYVVAVENKDESGGKQELESKILDEVFIETKSSEDGTADNSVFLKQRRSFRKKSKLTPVAGKIPQELDMPDFYFLNIVTKSGTHTKNMHAGKDQFKCLFCSVITKWRGNMCRHVREVHGDLLDSGAALIMPLQLNTQEGKVMKMTEYIQMEMTKKPNKRMRGVESQDLPGDYPCEHCGKVFNRLRYLRIHLQQHKLKKDLLCALCSKTFKTKNNLNQHLKTHEEREPYKCPDCDFESSVNIAIHKHRQIHNANSLLCDICGQAYSDKSTLKKHKQVHDPSRPLGCTIPGCTWRFRTQVMCDAHIQGHGTKRTFKCDLCGYAFRQKHHLQRHEKVVHNIVHEVKPYRPYYNEADSNFNENQFENISQEDRNEMEVSQGVNLIINEGNMSNVITADHFDLESALQSGQLVIAADDGSINYEMSDIGTNVVYQTLLPDGEVQQFETVSISHSDTCHMTYEGVEAIQSEVEIEQS